MNHKDKFEIILSKKNYVVLLQEVCSSTSTNRLFPPCSDKAQDRQISFSFIYLVTLVTGDKIWRKEKLQ